MATSSWGTTTAGSNVSSMVRPGNNSGTGGFWEFDIENPGGSSASEYGQCTWGGTDGEVTNEPNGSVCTMTFNASSALWTVNPNAGLTLTPAPFSYITQIGVYAWVDGSTNAVYEEVKWSSITVTFYNSSGVGVPYLVEPSWNPIAELERIIKHPTKDEKSKPKEDLPSPKKIIANLSAHSKLLIVTPDDQNQVRVTVTGTVDFSASAKKLPVSQQAIMGQMFVWTE